MKGRFACAAAVICLACSRSGTEPRSKLQATAPLAASTAAPSPSETLNELDPRRALPLLPMMALHQKESMRQHLEAVEQVVAAASESDFDNVALAAKRMGYSESMARMCEHMGASAPGFVEQALTFHHTADEIVAAAMKRDRGEVLAALSKTLKTCTRCHASYRQQLVASMPE